MGKQLRRRVAKLNTRKAGYAVIRKNKQAFKEPGSMNSHKQYSSTKVR